MAKNVSEGAPRRGRPGKEDVKEFVDAARRHLGVDGMPVVEPPAQEMRGHNRDEMIREACRKLAELESERASISEDIRELKQIHIKGELGFKLADFAVAYRLYKLEDDDRDTCLDTIRETFRALGIGEQLDWIKAMETPPKPSSEPRSDYTPRREGGLHDLVATPPYPKHDLN